MTIPSTAAATPPSRWQRFFDSDLWYSFRRSPVAQVSAVLVLVAAVILGLR